jgi:hypothetical protein
MYVCKYVRMYGYMYVILNINVRAEIPARRALQYATVLDRGQDKSIVTDDGGRGQG